MDEALDPSAADVPVYWFVQREYSIGAHKWLSRAIHELSREIHPILKETGHATVTELPEPG